VPQEIKDLVHDNIKHAKFQPKIPGVNCPLEASVAPKDEEESLPPIPPELMPKDKAKPEPQKLPIADAVKKTEG
jgi:hypothetical protein